jgi:carboxylate-amine ligase
MGYSDAIGQHLDVFSASMQDLRDEIEAADTADTGTFSLGVEEEYFLVDAQTGDVAHDAPEALFEDAFAGTDGRIEHELLRSQVEAVTRPCSSVRQVRAELRFSRSVLSTVAAGHGLALVAAGTHPTATWRGAVQSDEERYDRVMNELQMIGERNMLCGMHVHVSLPDPTRRIEVMRRILPYLPLFVALSTSSPFWDGRATGLKGYRLAAYDELPRTGLPELFEDNDEYDAYVTALSRTGAIPDASHLWWAIRPSHKYPTLELRAPDSCTHIEDAVAIAALYRVLVRHLYNNPDCNADMDAVGRALAVENKWRAQRFGVQGSFATKEGPLTVGEFLDKAIALTGEDAELLGCAAEIGHCREIVAQGTSADAQLQIFQAENQANGEKAAFAKVVGWIARNTGEVT